METREDLIHLLPEKIQRIFAATAPAAQRMMAARGLLPTTPENLVLALLLLQSDSDANVAAAARQSLQKLPENIMVTAIKHPQTPGVMLAALAPLAAVSPGIAQALILNPRAPDNLIVQLAKTGSETLGELIATNQQRLMNNPQIAVALAQNSQVLRSTVERVFDFLARNGQVVENCPEFEAAMDRLSPAERVEAANKVSLPPELEDFLEDLDVLEENAQKAAQNGGAAVASTPPATPAATVATAPVTPAATTAAAVATPAAQPAAPAFQKKEEPPEEEGEKKRIPMMKLIGTLNTAQKIALATKGNKEARSLLIKDANKQVATSVIKSPGITDQEIAAAAASRSVNEEVIRIICKSASMQRAYMVKVALVNNPRVPLALALKLLPTLRKNDVKMVAKSKDVPAALVNLAKKLCQS